MENKKKKNGKRNLRKFFLNWKLVWKNPSGFNLIEINIEGKEKKEKQTNVEKQRERTLSKFDYVHRLKISFSLFL